MPLTAGQRDGIDAPGGERIAAHHLGASYAGVPVFHDVSFILAGGVLTGLIGPNGSGKTTLLHTLCGIHCEMTGEVRVAGRSLRELSRRAIARSVALVPQSAQIDFEITVQETVCLGRYPWVGPLTPLRAGDRQVIEEALAVMDLTALRARSLNTLSGGERQRVFLARALAQATPALLLDEPVASLDLRYQQETYERLRSLACEKGVAILVADHHLSLVGAMCDRILVLHAGGLWAAGTPREIITEEMIGTVFAARMRVRHDERGRPQCLWGD